MANNINVVALTGNLTRDPDVRQTPGGTTVCKFGLAVNERYKNGASGEWQEYANFFDITVFGVQAENCGKFLARGRAVAIQGRLRWSSWEKDGQKRSKVEVIANTVQFLGGREDGGGGGGGYRMDSGSSNSESGSSNSGSGYSMGDSGDASPDDGEFVRSQAAAAADDDIPF